MHYTGTRRVPLGQGSPGVVIDNLFPRSNSLTVRIATLRLGAEPRVDRTEAKAGFTVALDYHALDTGADADATGVAPEQVVDLTTRRRPDGTLDWTPRRDAGACCDWAGR